MIRSFNNEGLNKFKQILMSIKNKEFNQNQFSDLLISDSYSIQSIVDIDLQKNKEFNSRYDFGKYLFENLSTTPFESLYNNVGFWTWLSAFYFDLICPKDEDGERIVKQIDRYILSKDIYYSYKHLVYYSWFYYHIYKEKSIIFLNSKVHEFSEINMQIGRRADIVNNIELVDVLFRLYWNSEKNQFKSGYTSDTRPGSIRRFPLIFNQLILTYDLYSMSADQIYDILPDEFNQWK